MLFYAENGKRKNNTILGFKTDPSMERVRGRVLRLC